MQGLRVDEMGQCCWSGDTVDGTGPVSRMRVGLWAGCGQRGDGGGWILDNCLEYFCIVVSVPFNK